MDVILSSLLQEFEMYAPVKDVTKCKVRTAFKHLVSFCGDIVAKELSPGRCNKWATHLTKQVPERRPESSGLSLHTIKGLLASASQVFAWALRQRGTNGQCEYGLTMNPFVEADPVRVDQVQIRYYSEDEASEILATVDEVCWHEPTKRLMWYAAILLALQSGLRKNEIANLRWQDIDLDNGRVLIQHRRDRPGEYWAWISKSRHEGEVPLGQLTWDVLMRLREVRPWTYPFLGESRYQSLLSRTWPLPERLRDNPVANWTREFNYIIARVNRKREAGGGPILDRADFHMLRKSCGTWLAERGVPEHYVQHALRHASPDTTRKHYVGLHTRQCDETVRATVNTFNIAPGRT